MIRWHGKLAMGQGAGDSYHTRTYTPRVRTFDGSSVFTKCLAPPSASSKELQHSKVTVA